MENTLKSLEFAFSMQGKPWILHKLNDMVLMLIENHDLLFLPFIQVGKANTPWKISAFGSV